jgi:hypothetical protein
LFYFLARMNTTTTFDATNGVITRLTVFHNDFFNYRWLLVALAAFALIAWALRKIFWVRDSN